MITVGSLFSGVGGIELGLERAGFEVKWQCEVDAYCQQILKKHWPEAKLITDVRNVSKSTVETVDCICGGFPCQPVSVAGKRKAQADSRWLWPEVARVLDEIRPRFAILENVPGLLTAGGSEVFADLASLGYDAEWCCFPASAIGAWHKRDRWWCVAADTQSIGRIEGRPRISEGARGSSPTGGSIRDPDLQRLEVGEIFGGDFQQELEAAFGTNRARGGIWFAEPDVGRVAHGVSNRVDRIRCLGNAVVPQAAQLIGRRILTLLG